ncbi:MAG: hypothetical protein GZ094_11190 [Mariniphaga sp.]|nr:hypothetical protein [Mariniphaga sp.]
MEYILKLLTVFLIASVKYFWATPYSFGMKLNEWETIFFMEAGGILGFLFFYYFFGFLFRELKLLWPIVYHFTPVLFKVRFEMWRKRRKIQQLNARKFTKRNKLIVRMRKRYGMWGLVVLSPIVLSIPVGALLGNKYFRHDHHFIPYMLLSIVIWGIVSVSFFSTFMNH